MSMKTLLVSVRLTFSPNLFLILEKDIQFFITSHHPYIINEIPTNNWYIFHREGMQVSIMYGEEVSDRFGKSKQRAFIQLINDPFFARKDTMNIYIVTEGKAEKIVFKHWIPMVNPSLSYIERLDNLSNNNFYIISGMGTLIILRLLKTLSRDVNQAWI